MRWQVKKGVEAAELEGSGESNNKARQACTLVKLPGCCLGRTLLPMSAVACGPSEVRMCRCARNLPDCSKSR